MKKVIVILVVFISFTSIILFKQHQIGKQLVVGQKTNKEKANNIARVRNSSGLSWKERTINFNTKKNNINEAREDLNFEPKLPSKEVIGSDIEQVVIDDVISDLEGNKISPKPIEEHGLYVFYENDIVLSERNFGYKTEDEALNSGYDWYMNKINIAGHKVLAFNKGKYEKNDQGQNVLTTVPSTQLIWWDKGVVCYLASQSHEYKQLIPIAENIIAK